MDRSDNASHTKYPETHERRVELDVEFHHVPLAIDRPKKYLSVNVLNEMTQGNLQNGTFYQSRAAQSYD